MESLTSNPQTDKNSLDQQETRIREMLEWMGDDPTREGLKDTPKRYTKFLKEFTSPEPFEFTCFANEGDDDLIVQTGIPFFSLCEHHLAPFFGIAAVGYIPKGRIVGLSKLARAVDWYSRRLQNQERITHNVAARIEEELSPAGVAVILQARHLCMEMRGIKKTGAQTTTSRMTGAFFEKPEARAEFLNLANL